MKKFFKTLGAFTLLLLMLTPAFAMADTLQKLSAERMNIETIPGLVYQEKFEDGYCRLVIDDEATNWSKVLLHRGAGSEIHLMCSFEAPEWATQVASITGNIWETDEAILQELKYAELRESQQSNMGRNIAVYTEEKQLLSPVKTNGGSSPFIHAIHWTDGNGRHLYEVAEIEFEHTSPLGRKIVLPKLDASLIKTNIENLPGVHVTLTDGALTYAYDPDLLGSSQKQSILTRIKAPVGAFAMRGYYEYGGYLWCSIDDGYATVYTDVYDFSNDEIYTGTHTAHMSIVWYDENDQILEESGVFSITRTNEKQNQPWMYYVQQDIQNGVIQTNVPWKPAKLTQADVVIGYETDERLVASPYWQKTIDPETAHVHISLKEDAEITIEAAQTMAQCSIHYFIQPPAGAVSCSWTRHTRNHYFGRQTNAYIDEVERLLRKERLPVETGIPILRANGMFKRLNTQIKDVVLYSMGLETAEDRGAAYMFCWFDQNGNPIEINYIAETAERLLLEPETKTYVREDDIKHPVKGPVFIDNKNTGWKLRAEYYVQEGSNAYMVELHMEDKHGNPVYDFGDEKLVFYLPYREHEDLSNHDFYLMHYEGGNLNNGLPVQVTKTENGLRFEVDNLSPFVVSWEDEVGESVEVDDILETVSINSDIEVARSWTLWEPTSGIREASPLYNSPEALDTALRVFLKSEMPHADSMVTFELFPVKFDDDHFRIISPEEFPENGLDVYIPFTDGIPAGADQYLAAHMLAYDTAEKWAGSIEKPLIKQITTEGMWIHLNSTSPVGIAWKLSTHEEENPVSPEVTTTPAPSVPQTGDSMPLMTLFCLMLLSAVSSILILKRNATNK